MKYLTIKNGLIAACVVIALLLLLSVWMERTPELTGEQGEARGKTIAAIQYARITDTVYRQAITEVVAGRVVIRERRDTLLRHLTDTLLVKSFIATTDTMLVRDSVALARADSAIAAQKRVTEAVQAELQLAHRLARPKRFAASASALYDPLNAVPVASIDGSFRVIGRLSLIVRGEQRFAAGRSPTIGFGAALAF